MNILYWLLGLGVVGFSARWNWWRRSKPGIPLLMYHKIGPVPKNSRLKKLWVTPEQFERQLGYLSSAGYRPVSFNLLEKHLQGRANLPLKPVIVTIDDGYENNYTYALPLLQKFGFQATIFLVTETIGQTNLWHDPQSEERLPMLNWEQIREMKLKGIEFGSHTLTHPNLEKCDREKIINEITQSKKILEENLKQKVNVFSYPYGGGAFSPEIQQIVQEAGYTFACAIRQGKAEVVAKNYYCLKRLLIRGDDNLLDFQINLFSGRSRF
ncbi:MAG: polysaccharide deacetylase family protein [Elusimicrobiota bacterium]